LKIDDLEKTKEDLKKKLSAFTDVNNKLIIYKLIKHKLKTYI